MDSSGLGKGPLVLRAEGCYLKNTDGRAELGIQIALGGPASQPVSLSSWGIWRANSLLQYLRPPKKQHPSSRKKKKMFLCLPAIQTLFSALILTPLL